MGNPGPLFSESRLRRVSFVIFVTVGNATQGFGRLLNAVDRLAGEGAFGKDMVFIQSGNNPNFRPLYSRHEPFLSMEDFEMKIHEADLVISHAGAGTLFHTLQAGKVSIVMPRRKKYGEMVDEHQIELAKVLVEGGRFVIAYEPEDLPMAIKESINRRGLGVKSEKKRPMLDLVAKAIEELVKR